MIDILTVEYMESMEPVINENRAFEDIQIAGITMKEALTNHINNLGFDDTKKLSIKSNFWISEGLLKMMLNSNANINIIGDNYEEIASIDNNSETFLGVGIDEESILVKYPWDLIEINSNIIAGLTEDNIENESNYKFEKDGFISVGEGTKILPGVYIEGNAIIGKNCKIGPNCYIRGNTFIGDNCHIGQAVEVKNCLLMNNVSIGHLSYTGDSVICPNVNFGAGTITANLRHDGLNHKSTVQEELIDTGRRKLGVIIGDAVHTGINTSFYPGRKMWANTATKPGDIVNKDIKH